MCVCVCRRSICEMNLEAELFTLQDSNNKLVAALHEANANVEQWKKQLAAYQEETERLRDQVPPPVCGEGLRVSDLRPNFSAMLRGLVVAPVRLCGRGST